MLICAQLFVTLWSVAQQAPLSMAFSRQEYLSSVQLLSHVQLLDPLDYSLPGSFSPWNFLGKNTGVGCHFFLQRIFLTQESNLHLLWLLYCRWILYH